MKTMTTEEFRDRIRTICLGPNYIRRSNPALVRTPTDKGFYPPCQDSGRFESDDSTGNVARRNSEKGGDL